MACRTGSAATATGCKLDAMPTTPSLLPMEERHWPHVRAIYLEGIATLQATFETTAPESWAAWSASKLDVGRTVAVDDEGVCGWTTLARVSARPVYAGVAEVTVYVATRVRGRGVGRTLMAKLVADSEAAGIWTLQSSIFPENAASYALHLGAGFREVGRRERIAQQHGVWRDTVLLERRSRVVGA